MSSAEFITINPEADIETIVAKYEEITNTTLYPGQDARILINIFAYYINLLKCQFNDAANLNLIENSRYPILDFLGKRVKCERLEDESEENYIKRILLAPEGYSVAGPESAYIYHALSTSAEILDATVEAPDNPIRITSQNGYVAVNSKELSSEDFEISVDDNWETVELTLNRSFNEGEKISVTIPHPYKLNLNVLTQDDETSNDILEAVAQNLIAFKPIADKVNVLSSVTLEFIVSGTVIISKNAIQEEIESAVNASLKAYFDTLKCSLNKKVDLYDIKNAVRSINGVIDFNLTTPAETLPALKNIRYKGAASLSYERVS